MTKLVYFAIVQAAVATAVAAAMSCSAHSSTSGKAEPTGGGTTGSGASGGVGDAGGMGGAPDSGPIDPTDTHVDGGGDCAPDAQTPYNNVACCDDVACQGWCYQNDVGGLYCQCGQPPYGVPGGCPEGTICCVSACVAPGWCDFSP